MSAQITYLSPNFSGGEPRQYAQEQRELFKDGSKLSGFAISICDEVFTSRSILRFLAVNSIGSIVDVRRVPVYTSIQHSHAEVSDYILRYGIGYLSLLRVTNACLSYDGPIQELSIRDMMRTYHIDAMFQRGIVLVLSSAELDGIGMTARYLRAFSQLPSYRGELHKNYDLL